MQGILMRPDMIQAIIEGRKTQTRRVIKLDGYSHEVWDKCIPHNGDDAKLFGEPYLKVPYDPIVDNAGKRIFARYHIGETVYIKEVWAEEGGDLYYKANWKDGEPLDVLLWKSPLFMPEWAARYFIVIEQVRAERLQEITEEDAEAEGVSWSPVGSENYEVISAVENFANLWDTINPKYPWESNPWVFPYTFRLKE